MSDTPDVFGQAISDFFYGKTDATILVETNLTVGEEIDVAYLFRDYEDMPEVEQLALKLCSGKILDVGAGAGAHTLWLQDKGKEVTAIDHSPKSCETMQLRGVRNVICQEVETFSELQYDTILLLMNGIGIAGTLNGMDNLLAHLRKLLVPGGKILLESTDIVYMFEEEDGSVLIDLHGDYHGEMSYKINYRDQEEEFPWLYVGPEVLEDHVTSLGFNFEILYKGPMNSYLAELKRV